MGTKKAPFIYTPLGSLLPLSIHSRYFVKVYWGERGRFSLYFIHFCVHVLLFEDTVFTPQAVCGPYFKASKSSSTLLGVTKIVAGYFYSPPAAILQLPRCLHQQNMRIVGYSNKTFLLYLYKKEKPAILFSCQLTTQFRIISNVSDVGKNYFEVSH